MAKNEAKIKFTAETGDFNESIKKANDEMSQLRAELKLNETQMKGAGASVESLEKKHTLLENQLKASESKTEALSQKVQKAAEIFGENSSEVTKLKTQLANAQSAEEKARQAIANCNKELEDQKRTARESESATGRLTDTIDKQQTELTQLKKKYADLVLESGKNSKEAKELAREIRDLSGNLKDNKRAFDNASDSADRLDRSLDNVGDGARGAGDGFTVAKGAIADLAADAVQNAIGKVKEFIGYLKELPEATRELRQKLNVLNTSFEGAGLTSEQATASVKDLYSVLGNEDRAVEATSLVAKMAKSQEDLNEWTTILTGVWGSYGESLPVEGLAEASNETAKTGRVTGVLADALNWSSEAASMFAGYMSEDVTTAEDAFNEALADCTTEAERQALINETLTSLYSDAARQYEETSGSLIEANKAAYEAKEIENELGEAIEPVTAQWQGMKNELLSGFIPVIQTVSTFLSEHPVLLKTLAGFVGVLAVGLTGLGIALAIMGAQAMFASVGINLALWPVLAIIAAVAALVAIIIVCVEYWDEIVAAVKTAATACWNAIKVAWDWICNLFAGIGEWVNTNVIQPVVKFFTGLWNTVKNIWNGIVNAIKVAFMFIGSIISAAFNIITLPFRFIWENCKQYVFAAFEWIKDKISKAVQAIKNIFSTIKNFFAGIWNGVKNIFAPVVQWFREKFQSAKQAVQNAWSTVKNFFSNIWSGVKTAFSNVGAWFRERFTNAKNNVQNAWSSVTGFFSNIKNKIINAFSNIREKLSAPFKAAIDKIKGFFNNLKLKFPNIKLPHFSIQGKFSLSPPSVPKLKIDWYKDGGIFTRPTIFNTPYGMKGVGEAGAEAVLPIDRLQGYISNAIDKSTQMVNLNALATAIEDLANRPIEMNINGRQFALATASDTDSVSGLRTRFVDRGMILE